MNEDRISAYLAGELTPDEASAFEEELAASDALRREVTAWRETLEAAQEWATADAPGAERADALTVPLDELPASRPAPVVAFQPRRLIWQAAAAAAIFLAGLYIGGNTKESGGAIPQHNQIGAENRQLPLPSPTTPPKPGAADNAHPRQSPQVQPATSGAPVIAAVSTRYAKDERGRLTIETTQRTGARALWVVDGGFRVAQTALTGKSQGEQ